MTPVPALSVVALAPDRFETVARTVSHLAAQDAAAQIELILVAPAAGLDVPASAVAPFAAWRVVRHEEWHSTSEARAGGIRQASAPIVVLVEDHCYPAPGWARALIDAHQEDWAGVGPVMLNANPGTLVSWANLVIEYGPWMTSPSRGESVDHIPGHNSSYKRDVLLAYGPQLGAMMEAESVLQWDLAARGHRFTIAPDARTRHKNFSRVLPSLALRFNGGRLFAANRARHWPGWRRLMFAAGSPLLPGLRTWRARRALQSLRDSRPRRGLLPLIFALLTVDAAGECAGYAAGGGQAMMRLTDLEFHRDRFLAAGDREGPAS